MSPFEIAMVAGMAAVTFAVRYPVLALVGRLTLPESLMQALKFIPPAVLTAIVAPAILFPTADGIQLHYSNSYLMASIVAALVAWRSNNLLATIVTGMTSFWLWRWLLQM